MSIGIWQILLILLVVLILFGAGRLPRVMGDIGKGVRSLKDGLREDDDGVLPPTQQQQNKPTMHDDENR